MIANIDKILAIPGAANIGNDLILLSDLSKLPIPPEPRRSEHIIVALCLQGEAVFTVDTKERRLCAGDLIIIQKDRVTANFNFSPDAQGMAMIWSKEYFDDMIKDVKELNKLFLFSRIQSVVKLSEEEIDDVKSFIKIIKSKMDDEANLFRTEIVQSLIMTLIYIVSNAIHRQQTVNLEGGNKRSHEIFMRFINLVETNFRTERRVGWYAERMNITSKYLSEMVKQVSQRTPNEWIDIYVLREIRILLRNTPKSIKEITDTMNFPSQSFLGKFFKERIGISPKEYRKK